MLPKYPTDLLEAERLTGGPVVGLQDHETKELEHSAGSNWKTVSGTAPTQVTVSNAAEKKDEKPVVLTDNPKDKDYFSSEDDRDEEKE